jgi:hypothetical protein
MTSRRRATTTRRSLGLAVAVAVAVALGLCAAPLAVADSGSLTFTQNGNCAPGQWNQFFTVPPNVNYVIVEARGGAGGDNDHTGTGGLGGYASAPVPVSPHDTLAMDVGVWGNAHGGCGLYPGGDRGYNSGGSGKTSWGGGSGTSVWKYDGPSAGQVQLVAGGGGGGGGNGHHAGGNGGAGNGSPGDAGGGDSNGVGGCGACMGSTRGGTGQDTLGGSIGGAGGGGGGGAKGGYNGGAAVTGGGGGGGGGSSYASDTLNATFGTSDSCPGSSAAACDGSVTISWDTDPAAIAVDGGDAQETPAGGPYAHALSARVTDKENLPVLNAEVTFTLPTVGPSGTFTDPDPSLGDDATTAHAFTGSNGVAVVPYILQANGTVGEWRATAAATAGGSATFHLENTTAPTSTQLSSSNATAVAGQPVTFHADVATAYAPQANWQGTVQFEVDGAPLGSPVDVGTTGTADSEATRFGIDGSAIGDHTVTAIYSGDHNHDPSRSADLTQHVLAATTTTTLATTPRVSTTGEAVTLTAKVTSQAAAAGAVPPGTVDFYAAPTPGSDPVPIATGITLGGGGSATFTTTDTQFLQDGAYRLRAVYSGASSFRTSATDLTQNVGADATGTLLTSDVNPSVYGQPVTLTATVARSGDAGVAPHGAVTFARGGTTLCSAVPVVEDDDPNDGDGVAGCTVADGELVTGANPVTASFVDPDGTYQASTGAMTQQVAAAVSTTTVDATPTTGALGTQTRLRAVVAAQAPGDGRPVGTVQFSVDDMAVGTPVAVTRDGVAVSAPLPGLTVGVHRLSAAFEDDADPDNLLPSGGALTYRVAPAPTTLGITSDANPAPSGQAVVLTAHALAVGNAGTVAGEVQFLVDGAASGAPVPLRDGYAELTPLSLAEGTHTVVARLQGTSEFATSVATFSQRVTAPSPHPPPPAPPTPPTNAEPAKVAVQTSRVTAGGDGVVNVVLGCSGQLGQTCSGRLSLTTAAGARYAVQPYSLAPGVLRVVRLPLSAAAQRTLVAHGRLSAVASAVPAVPGAAKASRAVAVLAQHAPAAWVDPHRTAVGSAGTVALRVRCVAWARCTGRLTLSLAGSAHVRGSATLAVAGSTLRTVRVRLDAALRRTIVKHGSRRLVVHAATTLPAGRPTVRTRHLTVTATGRSTR